MCAVKYLKDKKDSMLVDMLVTVFTIAIIASLTIPVLQKKIYSNQYKLSLGKTSAPIARISSMLYLDLNKALNGVFEVDQYRVRKTYISHIEITQYHNNINS